MTELEQHVRNWIADKAQDYDGNKMAVLEDLMKGGCQSGYVNHLIYSHDCREFIKEYMVDIEDILNDIQEEGESKDFLFDDNGSFTWDRVAWLAFEHIAFNIYSELENTEEAA